MRLNLMATKVTDLKYKLPHASTHAPLLMLTKTGNLNLYQAPLHFAYSDNLYHIHNR